jgi:hypothetical protein
VEIARAVGAIRSPGVRRKLRALILLMAEDGREEPRQADERAD